MGDCYFLDSCSEIANSSARIEDIFLTKTYNSNGIFAAKVYIKGIETIVTVDDYLPFVTNYTNTMVFAVQDIDSSIWSSVLEKMWAKVNGNYQRI
ncbi:MAG: C2 family cysteine protease [Candidatus Roizmanbacteria bacterium]